MKQCGTASKTCEKHGHSAMLQLSHLLLIVPFKELFSQTIGIQVSSLHVLLGVWFLVRSLEVSFRASVSPE